MACAIRWRLEYDFFFFSPRQAVFQNKPLSRQCRNFKLSLTQQQHGTRYTCSRSIQRLIHLPRHSASILFFLGTTSFATKQVINYDGCFCFSHPFAVSLLQRFVVVALVTRSSVGSAMQGGCFDAWFYFCCFPLASFVSSFIRIIWPVI